MPRCLDHCCLPGGGDDLATSRAGLASGQGQPAGPAQASEGLSGANQGRPQTVPPGKQPSMSQSGANHQPGPSRPQAATTKPGPSLGSNGAMRATAGYDRLPKQGQTSLAPAVVPPATAHVTTGRRQHVSGHLAQTPQARSGGMTGANTLMSHATGHV